MDVASNAAYPTPYANSPLLPLLLMSLVSQKNSPTTKESFADVYDFIVVGSGSAGSVVASRLSEIPCVRVLLLEAGKAPPLLTEVPTILAPFWRSDIAWDYVTVPQNHTAGSQINRQIMYTAGKTLGGSSTINGMIYTRGNRKNYDNWAAAGAVGWSFNDVYPYFLKMEDQQEAKFLEDGYHVRGGPITVSSQYISDFDQQIRNAANELGINVVDSNGKTQTGLYDFQINTRNSQKCSTAKGYLVPAENRTNLDIVANAHVTQVIIEDQRAVGVKFDHNNATHEVRVSREVILSAGSVNTPKLLMLSGIGPRDHLEYHKIKVIEDLPVGNNVQDHGVVTIEFTLNSSVPSINQVLTDPRNVEEYINNKTGPLSSTNEIVAFLNRKISLTQDEDFPEFELYFLKFSVESYLAWRVKDEVYQEMYVPYENKSTWSCFSQILQPKGRGTVRLQSTDPYDPPLIDPNYLGDQSDADALVEGLKMCHKFGTSSAMQKLGSKRFDIPHPECKDFEMDSDEYYYCLTRHIMFSVFHIVGTTKMGDPNDTDTVLDPQLRVKGIEGLRVVDASVMPVIPSANINIPVIMVAEKAADIIKTSILCKPAI